MDDNYFISLVKDIPRQLTATNVKMWKNYCAYRAGMNVMAMPKMSDDAKHEEMAKQYTEHVDILCCSELACLLPIGVDKRNFLETAFFNYSTASASKARKKGKAKASPKLMPGNAIWKRFCRTRAVIMNTIIPVWNDSKCFDTFPSGSQLIDFLLQIRKTLASIEPTATSVASSGTLHESDDEHSEDEDSTTTPQTAESASDPYSTPTATRLPLVNVITTSLNIANSEAEDAVVDEVPMPPEWLVFVKFGPPANGDCDHIWLLEAADDSKSNKKFSRMKQREEKLERDEKERAATRSAEPSNKKPKTEDAEVAALEKFNNLLEVDQIGSHYREAFAAFPHLRDEFGSDYEEFLRAQLTAYKNMSNKKK